MRNYIGLILAVFATASIFLGGTIAFARTDIQQLTIEAKDGNRITGFIYQDQHVKKDAPLAILMHGMMGSSLHWLAGDNVTSGDVLTDDLVKKGYRVVALDARAHGARKNKIKPIARLRALKSGKPDAYLAMINGTVSDYSLLLQKLTTQLGRPRHIMVVGYSMGAQMAILLAAQNKDVTHLITMVPPRAKDAPSVAPINHAEKIDAKWLLLTANKDRFATAEENKALAKAAGGKITHKKFDSGHMLPAEYLNEVSDWVASLQE